MAIKLTRKDLILKSPQPHFIKGWELWYIRASLSDEGPYMVLFSN